MEIRISTTVEVAARAGVSVCPARLRLRGHGVLVEQAAALEEAEHAALQRALEAEDVVGNEMSRLDGL